MNSSKKKLLIIGLDGLEISYAQTLMDAGEMPHLKALRDRSAQYLLDHGSAQRTGLAWEHVASGLSPKDANRWSAVEFNPETYQVHQQGARFSAFLDRLDANAIVFDPPYIDLRLTSNIKGIVGWGAHDPGTALRSNPPGLAADLLDRFGPYPAPEWVYACPEYSVERCEQMGRALVKAIQVRQQATQWLFQTFSDSDVFYVVTGEIHSAIEALWHGVDPDHPLAHHPSAPAAATSLRLIHRAVDEMVGTLTQTLDAEVVAFSMGGMGTNYSDVASMVLLPELLYRHAFGTPYLQVPQAWRDRPDVIPQLEPTLSWHNANQQWYPSKPPSVFARAGRKLTGIKNRVLPQQKSAAELYSAPLSWQPTTRYQVFWPNMPAFALPSFYDGRIRINLIGRETNGTVSLENYSRVCDEIESMVRACRDPRTGQSVVADVERPATDNPLALDTSDADLTIVWNGVTCGFEHPQHGLIGPVPMRRTGGHTGPHGVAYFQGKPFQPGFQGMRSSFDVVPTIADWIDPSHQQRLSGESVLTAAPAARS